jgi:hypothetical protein
VIFGHIDFASKCCSVNTAFVFFFLYRVSAVIRLGLSVVHCRFFAELDLHNFNPLTPNDHHSGRNASLTSKSYILYIYSTNVGTEYFNLLVPELSF